MLFTDRSDAGRRLAERLRSYRDSDVVVLGLPRGGVPVAYEVARELGKPLDVIVVRKLGVPHQPELAMGAIGEGGARILNDDVVQGVEISEHEIETVEKAERAELQRRVGRFRDGRSPVPLADRTAVLVDDGVATGSTARAACRVARAMGAERVVVAIPVGAPDAIIAVGEDADEVVWLDAPSWFSAVGQWYRDFAQTTDEEVADLLALAGSERRPPAPAAVDDDPYLVDDEVEVLAGSVPLAGHLTIPGNPAGLVVFAHGSGSSRHSPRNRYVAAVLNQARLGTLLFDLLTQHEEVDRERVFDIGLLADRLVAVTEWLIRQPHTEGLRTGYFGASTGAAAALRAATEPSAEVAAVVSRGGRPDLAGDYLRHVRTPTLLIVGGHDDIVLELNQRARAGMTCERELAVVPGATHLFEEPGALGRVAELARDWFITHLTAVSAARA